MCQSRSDDTRRSSPRGPSIEDGWADGTRRGVFRSRPWHALERNYGRSAAVLGAVAAGKCWLPPCHGQSREVVDGGAAGRRDPPRPQRIRGDVPRLGRSRAFRQDARDGWRRFDAFPFDCSPRRPGRQGAGYARFLCPARGGGADMRGGFRRTADTFASPGGRRTTFVADRPIGRGGRSHIWRIQRELAPQRNVIRQPPEGRQQGTRSAGRAGGSARGVGIVGFGRHTSRDRPADRVGRPSASATRQNGRRGSRRRIGPFGRRVARRGGRSVGG